MENASRADDFRTSKWVFLSLSLYLSHSAVVYWSAVGDLVAVCVLGISAKEIEHERYMRNDDCAANSDVESHC